MRWLVVCALSASGCGLVLDVDPRLDAGGSSFDAGAFDGAMPDAATPDAAIPDAATPLDATPPCLPERCNGADDDCDGFTDEEDPADLLCPMGQACVGGTCEIVDPCTTGVDCTGDGVCVDLRTSVEHCGMCGNSCGTGERCVGGACREVWAGVTAGGDHTCAWTTAGEVYCWGRNESGQVGDGSNVDRALPTPVGIGDALQVDAGAAHTCALREGGAILCWGGGANGQLGNGATEARNRPGGISSSAPAVHVSAGAFGTLAALADGDVLGWGGNGDGALGDGTTTSSLVPVRVSHGAALEVALGAFHGCVRGRAGAVACAGNNASGQLGLGVVGPDVLRAGVVPGLTADQIDSAASFTLARAGGAVLCWGRNEGNPCAIAGSDPSTPVTSPIAIPRVTGATDVAAGTFHACAVAAGGVVTCWGRNDRGQCGNAVDDSVLPQDVTGLAGMVDVAAGNAHSCALTRAGALVCWGSGDRGQLGHGDRPSEAVTIPVMVGPPPG